ncbi:MAG: SMC-Scp complex subunit ScpB [Planctomycetaceae bacterium]|jgi:segregation and condensation protein B|nr:SMC-Scp complex subunit ScpB [Planctomycetaceae bacterium]
MSVKKSGKKIFVPTDNADLSDNSSDSGDDIVAENAGKKDFHGNFHDKTVKMCNTLGAKYYVENAAEDEDEEDATILSLESLREMFMSIKSGEIGGDSVADTAINDNIISQNTCSSCPEIPEVEHANVTSRSDCSKAKSDAHTGFGITKIEYESPDENDGNNNDGNDNAIDHNVKKNFINLYKEPDNQEITTDIANDVMVEDDVEADFAVDQDEIGDQLIEGSDDNDVAVQVNPESILEAMLFVGDRDNKPLTAERAAGKMRNTQPHEIDEAAKSLNNKYNLTGAPYEIVEVNGGYRMTLREEFNSIQEKFYGKTREAKLSQSAIDTLAVIAYKQPITAEEIQTLRKQPSGNLISQLIKRGLVQSENKTHNKKKKILYRTTTRFLELFQLDSVDDLPVSEDFDFR